VTEGGNEGADEELQYVDVAQNLDPSPEGPKANLWQPAQENTVLSPKPIHFGH
jgi:hypothetical protein